VPPGNFGVLGCGAKLLQHRLLGGGCGTLALLVVRVSESAHLSVHMSTQNYSAPLLGGAL
jgi:hypothetical protein